MAGLEAPWLAMVSSPEWEERRRKEKSSGARCWLHGRGKGGRHGVELHHKGARSLLAPGTSSFCCLHEEEEEREEREERKKR
jgi:hypothetical protein